MGKLILSLAWLDLPPHLCAVVGGVSTAGMGRLILYHLASCPEPHSYPVASTFSWLVLGK